MTRTILVRQNERTHNEEHQLLTLSSYGSNGGGPRLPLVTTAAGDPQDDQSQAAIIRERLAQAISAISEEATQWM